LAELSDVLVNGADDVWVDCGSGLRRTDACFADDEQVRRTAVRLVNQAGRRLDDACPHADVVLPDGTRLHAVLPPLVRRPTISLRVHRHRQLDLQTLVRHGSIPLVVADLLRSVVAARCTLLISGGPGTGKTTLLAALLAEVAHDERVVLIEDTPELTIDHPHVVSLRARTANAEGAGAIAVAALVTQALRMRADRIVVGEFRGTEVVELLAALNTGQVGGAATIHANSTAAVKARLVALACMAGIAADTAMLLADSAVDLLIHLDRGSDRQRRVTEIAFWSSAAQRQVWSRAAGFGPGLGPLVQRISGQGVVIPAELSLVISGSSR
jgi:pilus assembly protein CpaF